MDSYRNRAEREDCLSPRAQRERKLACERARRVVEVPLEYIPNAQFKAWSRDQTMENKVLGPMPDSGESAGKPRTPSGLAPYLASLYETPLLTREQETHLFRKLNYLKYKCSERRARLNLLRPQKMLLAHVEALCDEIIATRNQIVSANLRLVVSIVHRRLRAGQEFFEAVSDGNVSLIRAVERFDYALGYRFSTYATWAIVNNIARVFALGLRHRGRFRTDYPGLFQATADPRSHEHELEAMQTQRTTVLDGILRLLSDREREIIVCRYGLGLGRERQTLQEIGDLMGVSKERIRQIEARALGKLRQAVPAVMPEPMDGSQRFLSSCRGKETDYAAPSVQYRT
jgi:RNA polymerase primary sigma factor/RNA polymerase sigma factor